MKTHPDTAAIYKLSAGLKDLLPDGCREIKPSAVDTALERIRALQFQLTEKQKQYDIACNRIESMETGRNVVNKELESFKAKYEAEFELRRKAAGALADALLQNERYQKLVKAAQLVGCTCSHDHKDRKFNCNCCEIRYALEDLGAYTCGLFAEKQNQELGPGNLCPKCVELDPSDAWSMPCPRHRDTKKRKENS